MDLNISGTVLQYNADGSNKDEVIELLKTFVDWKLSDNDYDKEIHITDKRPGRNHLHVIEPSDIILTFNNGIANYIFNKPEQLKKHFGIVL